MHLRFADLDLCQALDGDNQCSPHIIAGNAWWRMDTANCSISTYGGVQCAHVCSRLERCLPAVAKAHGRPQSTLLILHDDACDATRHSPVQTPMKLGGMFYAVGSVSYILQNDTFVGFWYTWPQTR
jgi:hypothetical protein